MSDDKKLKAFKDGMRVGAAWVECCDEMDSDRFANDGQFHPSHTPVQRIDALLATSTEANFAAAVSVGRRWLEMDYPPVAASSDGPVLS